MKELLNHFRSLPNILLLLAGASIAFNTLEVGPVSYVFLFTLLYTVSILPKFRLKAVKAHYNKDVFCLLYFFLYLICINLVYFIFTMVNNKAQVVNTSILLNLIFFYSVLIHSIRDVKAPKIAMAGFVIGCIVLAAFFIEGSNVSLNIASGRLTIFDLNENDLGIYMVIASIVIFSDIILQNRLKLGLLRFIGFVPIIMMITVMFATASRTAVLIFALGCAFSIFLFATKRGKFNFFHLVFLVAGIALLILGYKMFEESDLLVMERFAQGEEGDQTSGRFQIWEALAPYILQNPIFGYGEVGYYEITRDAFKSIVDHSYGAGYSPHSVIVEVAVYTGIIGLYLMFKIWNLVFVNAWRQYKLIGDMTPVLLIVPLLFALVSGQALVPRHYYLIYLIALVPVMQKAKKVVKK